MSRTIKITRKKPVERTEVTVTGTLNSISSIKRWPYTDMDTLIVHLSNENLREVVEEVGQKWMGHYERISDQSRPEIMVTVTFTRGEQQ